MQHKFEDLKNQGNQLLIENCSLYDKKKINFLIFENRMIKVIEIYDKAILS